MKDIIIYIVENEINVIYKKKVINKPFQSIKEGFIINKEVFIDELLKLFKDGNIKTSIFGASITVVDSFYSLADKYLLEVILTNLGFNKVRFLSIKGIFTNKDSIYLEINNSYIVLYTENDTYYIKMSLFNSIDNFLKSIEFDRDIILFGLNEIIPDIFLKDKKIYFYDDYKKYAIKCLLNVNE